MGQHFIDYKRQSIDTIIQSDFKMNIINKTNCCARDSSNLMHFAYNRALVRATRGMNFRRRLRVYFTGI